MKKILFLLLVVFFSSCQEDVKFNAQAIQAQKDGTLWQAATFKAVLTQSNGYLVITATKGFETLTMRTNGAAPHNSTFGTDFVNYAELIDTTPNASGTFSTGIIGGSGEIKITDYSAGTITGTFKFNAINDILVTKSILFRNGTIYKIPVTIIQ
jgi:Family of unknown function (DUF6252)